MFTHPNFPKQSMFAAEDNELKEFFKEDQYYYDGAPKRFIILALDNFKEVGLVCVHGENINMYSLKDFKAQFTLSDTEKERYKNTVLLHWSISAGHYSEYSGCFTLSRGDYEILTKNRVEDADISIAKYVDKYVAFGDCDVDDSPDYYYMENGYGTRGINYQIKRHFEWECKALKSSGIGEASDTCSESE